MTVSIPSYMIGYLVVACMFVAIIATVAMIRTAVGEGVRLCKAFTLDTRQQNTAERLTNARGEGYTLICA